MAVVRTVRQQVADRLRAEVLAGGFPPGQPLREAALAERYGVSRGPVRDAFLQIAQEGLLDYHVNRGVTVRAMPEPENRAFIVSLRLQIECFVVEKGLSQLAAEGFAAIVAALAQLDAACDRGDAEMLAQRDMEFHQAILMGCGGHSFLPVWKGLCYQMLFAYTRLSQYRDVYAEHQRIVEALKSRDAAAVVAALKANII